MDDDDTPVNPGLRFSLDIRFFEKAYEYRHCGSMLNVVLDDIAARASDPEVQDISARIFQLMFGFTYAI